MDPTAPTATPDTRKRARATQKAGAHSFAELPPQMRGQLNALAIGAGLLPASGPSIPAHADVDDVVTSLHNRATRELTCYLRLVAMRITRTHEAVTVASEQEDGNSCP